MKITKFTLVALLIAILYGCGSGAEDNQQSERAHICGGVGESITHCSR